MFGYWRLGFWVVGLVGVRRLKFGISWMGTRGGGKGGQWKVKVCGSRG